MTTFLGVNTTPFDSLGRFSVGYDTMFRRIEDSRETLAKVMSQNYPPYNIVKLEENKYVIELAVAGIVKENIDITTQDGILTVTGKTTVDDLVKEGTELTYLYKGIADRSFTRKFTLAETVEVKNAELVNGMLRIHLENIIPDSKRPKKVEIVDAVGKVSEKTLLTEETNG